MFIKVMRKWCKKIEIEIFHNHVTICNCAPWNSSSGAHQVKFVQTYNTKCCILKIWTGFLRIWWRNVASCKEMFHVCTCKTYKQNLLSYHVQGPMTHTTFYLPDDTQLALLLWMSTCPMTYNGTYSCEWVSAQWYTMALTLVNEYLPNGIQ